MRFTEFKLITEDVTAMQEINRMSQTIVNYFNQRPELVTYGSKVPLEDIITDRFSDPKLELMRRTVIIELDTMRKFVQVGDRYELRSPKGGMSADFVDPYSFDPKTGNPMSTGAGKLAWDHARAGTVPYQVGMGSKLTLKLPADALNRDFDTMNRKSRFFHSDQSSAELQRMATEYARGIRSTIVHELNHNYNTLQGMDLSKARSDADTNKFRAANYAKWKTFIANADNEAFLNKNLNLFTDKDSPDQVKDLFKNSHELVAARKHFQQLERMIATRTEYIQTLEDYIKDYGTNDELKEKLTTAREQLANLNVQAQEERANIKTLSDKQKLLKKDLAKLKPDLTKPTEYHDDAYWSSNTEVNSRLQQVSLDIARELKNTPNMSNQAINDLIMKTFGNHQITVEFMNVDDMRTKWKLESYKTTDRNFKDRVQGWIQNGDLDEKYQRQAFASAMEKPEFKRYVNIAYKFVQAEQANPISMGKASEITLGQKLKAALTGIPQAEIPDAILPSAKDAAISGIRQAVTPGSPLRQNMVAATVEASKKLDTPGALKALEVGGKVLVSAGIVVEMYRGFDQIKALPADMPDDKYKEAVQLIIAKLVAEFGLVYVAALSGAWASGVALSAMLPGLGTVAGAVVGFIAGGAAGYLALEFAGDSVASITEFIVKELRSNRQPKLTGAQGAANARSAVSNFNTAGNPKPVQNESLARIVELSAVKKPT